MISLDRLPPWVGTNIKSRTSWKLLARCWLASWVAFILIIPNKSLTALGNAAFFCCICSFIVPPFLPVQMFFFAMATMLLGCLFGWGLGSAAMRAALASRSQVVLRSAFQKVQESAAGAANPDAVFTLEVFQGAFLDARSTVIFGVFLAVGAFCFALVRAYNPKLALLSVFGTVFLDVICSYGPLFPASEYFILNSFFISTTSYVAIGCAAIFLVFPETLNHQYLNNIYELLTNIRELVEIQERVLCVDTPNELRLDSSLVTDIRGKTISLISGIQKLDSQADMLGLEFTFGRFNGDDAKTIEEPLKAVISRIAGLQTFIRFFSNPTEYIPQDSPPESKLSSGDTYLLNHLRASHRQQEIERGLRPQDILPLLRSATSDLRSASALSLHVSEQLLERVNRRRWKSTPVEPEPHLDDQLSELRRARDDFKLRRRLEVIEPFSTVGGGRALFMALVFQANLLWFTDALIALLEVLAALANRRKKARVWAPKGLRMLWKFARSGDQSDRQALGEDERPFESKKGSGGDPAYRRDPDSAPPTHLFQHIGDALYRTYNWSKTPEAIYAFKYALVSVALWLPSVFPSSAYFSYSNKGLWALIMAQTVLEPYIADQIFSYVARLTATFFGLVIGLLVWYIGAARGNGNPYGVATVMAVLLVPLMFWRLFGPSPLPAIMCSVTVVLVVGYSWLDSHLETVGNPGVGWPVAWRRWLSLLVGCAASFFLMLLPPRSGRHAVRLSHAGIIFEISQLYSGLISRWLTTEEQEIPVTASLSPDSKPSQCNPGENKKEPRQSLPVNDEQQKRRDVPTWGPAFRYEIDSVWVNAQRLQLQTERAKWEGNIRGAWPSKTYMDLLDVETGMLANVAQLAGALWHLDPAWRIRLLHRTKVLNPNFITDMISVFTLVSQSLKTGEPLPEVMPRNLIDRVFYHQTLSPADDPDSTINDNQPVTNDHRRTETESEVDQLRSEEFMAYANGVAAVYQILTLLDRMHRLTKSLCGEVPMKGFQEWKETFERRVLDNAV